MHYIAGMPSPTRIGVRSARVAEMKAAVASLAADLEAYGSRHGGRFVLFGSAARGDMRHDSDVDILVDFPTDQESKAWFFAEDRAWAHDLKPDIHIKGMQTPRFLAQIEADAAGESMDGKVWNFVLDSAASSERHFAAGVRLFEQSVFSDEGEGYVRLMAFLHTMQAGHTSLEAALMRTLRGLGEDRPGGERWHEALIDQCATPGVGGRAAILPARLAVLAHATRSFRHFATHSYDVMFDDAKARVVVEAARELGPLLRPTLEAFIAGMDQK